MKQLLYITLILISINSYGQINRYSIGTESGVGLTYLRESKFGPDQLLKVGHSTGIMGQLDLTKSISIKTGLYYERKSSRVEYDIFHKNNQLKDKFKMSESYDYLTLPVLLKFSVGKKVRYFVNAGIYYSSLLQKKYK